MTKNLQPGVTIITPTIEERAELLAEACESVQIQTEQAAQHLVYFDRECAGPAVARNAMLHAAATEYVGFLDDDDVLDAEHIEVLSDTLTATGADLAFSWHRTEGDRVPIVPRFNEWSPEAEAFMHAGMNVIPVTVVAKREALLAAGGFYQHDHAEDYQLWLRMMSNGCRFACAPVETWTYRHLGGNRTWRSA